MLVQALVAFVLQKQRKNTNIFAQASIGLSDRAVMSRTREDLAQAAEQRSIILNQQDLLKKYDVAAPRYTSYPTVPQWEQTPTQDQWIESVKSTLLRPEASWSMYLHIPFCESLCTYCGCSQTITKNHERGKAYTEVLLKEWEFYLQQVPELTFRPLRTLHLGGGTPTFLSAETLNFLLKTILRKVPVDHHHFEGAIEVDPRRTNGEQLLTLHNLGFRRLSLGVQDFNAEVQSLINRIQPESLTRGLTEEARLIGYTSINFDLIYGLPRQNLERMKSTVEKTLQLRPDRIALYSLAIVPWIKPAQRLFKDEDLPQGDAKRELYEFARDQFLKAGYIEIGMDHFALPHDEMAVAHAENRLHRNFMGYTTDRSDVLIGLGASAISETPEFFKQNFKDLKTYENSISMGQLPTMRGHCLTSEDQLRRKQIVEFMTRGKVLLQGEDQISRVKKHLSEMFEDGLVSLEDGVLCLTSKGAPFLRNACLALDERRLRQTSGSGPVYSKVV